MSEPKSPEKSPTKTEQKFQSGESPKRHSVLGKRELVQEELVEVEEVSETPASTQTSRGYVIDADQYYAQIARIKGKDDGKKQRRMSEQREDRVRERLTVRGDCDLDVLACQIANCNRSFESVRVLAWHMSYSHTDSESSREEHWQCLVCGRQMTSVKGKNSHLATGHRDLCILHNTQCVQQRVPPRAPAVKRKKKIVPRYGGSGPNPEDAIQQYLLKDELVFDEDSDYEEDVSVPEQAEMPPGIVCRAKWPPSPSRGGLADPQPASETPKSVHQEQEADPVIVVDDEGDKK